MKVKEFIDALNAIGYDDNTELTFGFIDGYTGEWYNAPLGKTPITYGEEVTGQPYNNDEINIDLDIDSVKEYIDDKTEGMRFEIIRRIEEVVREL